MRVSPPLGMTVARHSAVDHDNLVINHAGLEGNSSGDPHPQYVLDSFVKSQRVSTGSVDAASSVTVTLTWTTPWADTNYTVTCGLVEGTAGSGLRIDRILTKTATAITVRVTNDAIAARTGTLQAIAIHD